MPQLKADEWPADGEPTTTEREALKQPIGGEKAQPQRRQRPAGDKSGEDIDPDSAASENNRDDTVDAGDGTD